MEISVELTLTPLQDDFEPAVINLIKRLRDTGLTVMENPLSTQIYGPYDEVMAALTNELKTAFESLDRSLAYMKIIKGNRSGFKPDY